MIRKALYVAVPAVVLAAVLLFVWASSVREWCAPNENRMGKLAWGQGKLHEPTLADCVRIVE